MKNSSLIKCTLTAAAMAVLAGCATGSNQNDEFPALSRSYLKAGAFVNPANVRRVELGAVKLTQANANTNINDKGDFKIAQGMHKDQVRLELSHPHFGEGMSPKIWNYAFNFYTAGAGQTSNGQYVTCQFQVRYNDDYRVESTRWNDPTCASLTAAVAGPAGPAGPVGPAGAPGVCQACSATTPPTSIATPADVQSVAPKRPAKQDRQ